MAMGLCRDVQPLRRPFGEAFVCATGMPGFVSITASCAGRRFPTNRRIVDSSSAIG